MAAFMPGESPPLVNTAILFIYCTLNQAGAPMAPKPRKVGETIANTQQQAEECWKWPSYLFFNISRNQMQNRLFFRVPYLYNRPKGHKIIFNLLIPTFYVRFLRK
jgi:hypothetical protein